MNVEIFYNNLLNITNKYVYNSENLWVKNLFLPKMKLDSFLITTDLLNDLFNNFHLKEIDISGMGFNDKVKESDEGNLIIGSIDTDQIVVDKKTQEVKLISEDGDILFYLAADLATFLSVLIEISDYSIQGFMVQNYKFTNEDRSGILKIVKDILKYEKYFSYYDISFGTLI
jgi:hypothetical protein